MGIIVIGHGHFATGIVSGAELIAGGSDSICAIDFSLDVTPDQLYEKISEKVSSMEAQNEKVLILCDLAGGTPFNVSNQIRMERGDQIELLGGINLPILLEIIFSLEDGKLTVSAEQLLEVGASQIVSAQDIGSDLDEIDE